MRSPRTELFWRMNGLPRWEQVAFAVVNLPFNLITIVLGFILYIPFKLMIILVVPFMLFAFVGSLVWMLCLVVIIALSWFTERVPLLRPISFTLAVPFMILGHNLNGLTPAPSVRDMEAKIAKWDLIEAFPFTWSLMRFDF